MPPSIRLSWLYRNLMHLADSILFQCVFGRSTSSSPEESTKKEKRMKKKLRKKDPVSLTNKSDKKYKSVKPKESQEYYILRSNNKRCRKNLSIIISYRKTLKG